MSSVDLIYYLYISFLVIAFIGVSFYVLKRINNSIWRPETLAVFIVFLYAAMIMGAFFSTWKLGEWRVHQNLVNERQTTGAEKTKFFQKKYPKLMTTIKNSEKYQKRLQTSIRMTSDLTDHWKNNVTLLNGILASLGDDLSTLKNIRSKATTGLEAAWKNRSVSSPIFIDEDDFKDASLQASKRFFIQEQRIDITYQNIKKRLKKKLILTRKLLKKKQIPIKPFFSKTNYNVLVNYAQKISPDLATMLEDIYANIHHANNQQKILQAHEEKMAKRFIKQWKQLRDKASKDFHQVLLSLEMAYIASQFQVPEDVNEMTGLQAMIIQSSTRIKHQLQQMKIKIERNSQKYPELALQN